MWEALYITHLLLLDAFYGGFRQVVWEMGSNTPGTAFPGTLFTFRNFTPVPSQYEHMTGARGSAATTTVHLVAASTRRGGRVPLSLAVVADQVSGNA